MATRSKPLDVQKLLVGAAKLEISLLSAGIETLQVYIGQASRFSELAAEALRAMDEDKASLADTTRKLNAFGRESLHTYADLAQRLSTRYYDEIDRIAEGRLEPARATPVARRAAPVKRKRAVRRPK